jgi:hypothetical protein
MRVVSPPLDLADSLTVVVDDNAEPTDFDAAVARFLLKVVERRHSQRNQTTPVEPATELSFLNTGDEKGS